MRLRGGGRAAIAAACTITLASGAAPASGALPACPDRPVQRTVVGGPGQYEAVLPDAQGRLLISDLRGGRVLRADAPGATATPLARVSDPGGLAVDDAGDILVGTGNGPTALVPRWRLAGLLRIDAGTGATTRVARGLMMANGVARAADGTVYASSSFPGGGVDRIRPDGTVDRRWNRTEGANGLALSADGSALYAAVMLPPARVVRIDTATGQATTFARVPFPENVTGLLDGLARGADGTLYVNAFLAGQVWRIGADPTPCVLARGLAGAAGITVGADGAGFSATSVYVATWGERVVELVDAAPAGPA